MSLVNAAELAEFGITEDVADRSEPRRSTGPAPIQAAWFDAYARTLANLPCPDPDDVSPSELESFRDGRDAANRDRKAMAAERRKLAALWTFPATEMAIGGAR